MTERRCGNCRWWENDQHAIGACMRNPPQRVGNLQDDWPKTHATDRCGEWADASITPEQEQMRELTRRFAVALINSGYDARHTWQVAAEFAAAESRIQREE